MKYPDQWRSQGHIFGGGKKGVARERRGKGCGQDEGDQKACGAWRVTTDLARGRVI